MKPFDFAQHRLRGIQGKVVGAGTPDYPLFHPGSSVFMRDGTPLAYEHFRASGTPGSWQFCEWLKAGRGTLRFLMANTDEIILTTCPRDCYDTCGIAVV